MSRICLIYKQLKAIGRNYIPLVYSQLITAVELFIDMAATKEFTRQEVALRDGKNGNPTWIIIRDMVYDVTDYLDEHPGGPELITDFAGRDGTKDFDDFGHSGAAMELLKKFKIGELNYCDRAKFQKQGSNWSPDGACVLPDKKRSKRRMFIFCG